MTASGGHATCDQCGTVFKATWPSPLTARTQAAMTGWAVHQTLNGRDDQDVCFPCRCALSETGTHTLTITEEYVQLCGAGNDDYPGQFACSMPSGHLKVTAPAITGTSVWDHADPERGAWWTTTHPPKRTQPLVHIPTPTTRAPGWDHFSLHGDVDRFAAVLACAWAKAEPDADSVKYPASYVAAWVEVARAGLLALGLTPAAPADPYGTSPGLTHVTPDVP